MVATKLASGDIYVTKAETHLKRDEWGMAYRSIVSALSRGNLSEEGMAYSLYAQICDRLGLKPRIACEVVGASSEKQNCMFDQV